METNTAVQVTIKVMNKAEAQKLVTRGAGKSTRYAPFVERVALEIKQGALKGGNALVFEIGKLADGTTDDREIILTSQALKKWAKVNAPHAYVQTSIKNSAIVVSEREVENA